MLEFLSGDIDRLVIDKTGVTAPSNLLLDLARTTDPAGSGPTIFTALEEQLGLRLRPTSAPVDVFMIDRVERPSEN